MNFIKFSRLHLSSCLLIGALLTALGAHAQGNVSPPNGTHSQEVVDLTVQSSLGEVQWKRVFNGSGWRFNRHWDGISASFKPVSVQNTGGGAPSSFASAGGGAVCWIWVDEDWQPGDATPLNPVSQAQPKVVSPSEYIPPNYAHNQTSTPLSAGLDSFFGACASSGGNITGGNGSDITEVFEGFRRMSQLYVGSGGTYIFKNRYVLKKQAINRLASSSGEPSGSAVNMGNTQAVANGWRWSDRGGDWAEYDDSGRISRYGDRNNNTIWIQRNANGQITHIIDGGAAGTSGAANAAGRVLITLHYNAAGFLVQAKDYPFNDIQGDNASRSVSYQYDSLGRMTAVTDARSKINQYGYDFRARLTSSTDPLGRVTSMVYENENNSVKQMTAADGGVSDFVFTYDDTKKTFYSKIQGPVSPAGRRTEEYTHDRAGDLIRYEVNGRAEIAIARDPVARTESRTNARGFTTILTKNEFEQVTQVQHPDGARNSTQYESRWLKPIEMVDELGFKTIYNYDANGNLIKKTEAQGTPDERVTEYELNSAGWPIKYTRKGRTEANGSVTADAVWQVQYDSAGQIKQTTDPEGHIRQYQFNRFGQLLKYTDPRGKSSSYTYDGDGNTLTETDPLGNTFSYAYDNKGNLISVTDPRGKVSQFAYDAKDRLAKRTDALGAEYLTSYNKQDQPELITDAAGKTMRLEYDALVRLTKATDTKNQVYGTEYTEADGTDKNSTRPSKLRYPTFQRIVRYDERERVALRSDQAASDSRVETFSYDKASRRKTFTNADGKTRYYNHNAFGQVAEVKDPLGNTMRLAHDSRGNVIQVTDPLGKVWLMQYDRRNLMTATVDPLGKTTAYAYNENGWLTDITQANGQKVTYAYDDAGRITRQQERNAANQLVKTTDFTYDAASNLLTWNDGNARATRSYDDTDRLSSETVSIGSGTATVNLTHAYTYYGNHQIKSYTGPDGQTIQYSYDGAAQLERVDIPGEGSIAMTEWQWYMPKKVLLPGGVEQRIEYDSYQSLTRLKVVNPAQATLFELENQYGKLAEIKQAKADNTTLAYQYDAADRLTQVSASALGRSEAFSYDANTNRSSSSNTGASAWQYDNAGQLSQRPGAGGNGSVSYTYDDSGNLSTKVNSSLAEPARTTRYAYDALNRLSEVRDGADNLIASYQYDPFDRRISKQLGNSATLATSLANSGQTPGELRLYLHSEWGLLAESNASGQLLASYGWSPQRENGTFPLYVRIPEKDSQGSATQNYRYAYYHNDHLGTPQRLTDKAGNLLWAADYDAYGKATTRVNASAQLATPQALRLPGQINDPETGLHYNDRRFYDPDTGRYLTRDPIGFEGGINLYTYAAGSPSRFTDPTGELIPCMVANYARCLVMCGIEGAASAALTGDCIDMGNMAKDCLTSCLWSMLPIPDPCGKFGKLFSMGIGLANSFEQDTLVHTRILTDQGYVKQLKRIADIQVGDEVLAWDEVKAFDIAQAKENLKLQANLQAKSASSRQEYCAECYENSSDSSASPTLQTALLQSAVGTQLTDSAESYQKVTHLMNSIKEQTLYYISLDNGEVFTATAGHPFKTSEGWRDAVMLKKGGKLLLKGGEGGEGDDSPFALSPSKGERYATITSIREEVQTIRMFNFEVAQLHTYFIGVDGVVVHNGTYDRPGGFRDGVRDKVWNTAIETSTGRVRDPQSGRFMSKCKPWDMGHKPGHEWRRHKKDLERRGADRDTVLNEHNDPNRYRPELPSSNRNHRSEDTSPF